MRWHGSHYAWKPSVSKISRQCVERVSSGQICYEKVRQVTSNHLKIRHLENYRCLLFKWVTLTLPGYQDNTPSNGHDPFTSCNGNATIWMWNLISTMEISNAMGWWVDEILIIDMGVYFILLKYFFTPLNHIHSQHFIVAKLQWHLWNMMIIFNQN